MAKIIITRTPTRSTVGPEWFCARWKGFEGSDCLSCCSYESEEQFRQPGGYYDDMKGTALDALNELLADAGTLCE